MLKSEKIRWFAVRVRSRHERSVAQSLQSKSLEAFVPSYLTRKRWADRFKSISLPLFPGYIFCRFDLRSTVVLSTPGVLEVVGVGRQPTPIEEYEITRLRRLVETDLNHQPWPYLRVGERVRLCYGPLAGMEGILTQVDNSPRVVISVELLQRSVAVEIDGGWAMPVHPLHSPKLGGPAGRAAGPV